MGNREYDLLGTKPSGVGCWVHFCIIIEVAVRYGWRLMEAVVGGNLLSVLYGAEGWRVWGSGADVGRVHCRGQGVQWLV